MSSYEAAASLLLLDTTAKIIKDYTLLHMHGVTVAAKALTYFSALQNSSTDTTLLDRLMVPLANLQSYSEPNSE